MYFVTLVSVLVLSNTILVLSQQHEIYGTQCSFAITGPNLDACDPELLDQRQSFYDEYMEGCYRNANKDVCDENEKDRLAMNARQPQSMVNMTSTGYLKLKAPDSLIHLLTEFWETNKHHKEVEEWNHGNVFTNNWGSPSYMVSVEDWDLVGGGPALRDAVWDAAIEGIAEWTGGVAKLRPVSLYGIREYTEGAVLSPHVDRLPLVSSGIVNVAQDVDEPWPLEVYDRNGHAINITMEVGDMILYESHSLIHGRPFPLKGRSFANVFIHFEPYDGWHDARDQTNMGDNTGDLPPYIIPGSPEEAHFRKKNPNGWFKDFAEGDEPPMNQFALEGSLEDLQIAAAIEPRLLWFTDSNGWAPIHEAARAGHLHIVKYLIENGADMNAITKSNHSPLAIAKGKLGASHKVTKYLEELGAELIGYNEEQGDQFYFEEDDEYDDDDFNEEEEDSVPTIIAIEKEIVDIVPTIVGEDDDEEL